VCHVDIETVGDLRKVLKEIGYSNKAIAEIIKWYSSKQPIN
jgi:hypothetical protein